MMKDTRTGLLPPVNVFYFSLPPSCPTPNQQPLPSSSPGRSRCPPSTSPCPRMSRRRCGRVRTKRPRRQSRCRDQPRRGRRPCAWARNRGPRGHRTRVAQRRFRPSTGCWLAREFGVRGGGVRQRGCQRGYDTISNSVKYNYSVKIHMMHCWTYM